MKLNKKSFSGVRIVRAGELEPGAVSEEQFWLLVDISPIHSEKIILALKDYFVSGYLRRNCRRRRNYRKLRANKHNRTMMTMKQTQKMRSFFRNRVTKALGMTLALMMASQSVLASLAADQTRYIFRGDKDALTITVTNNDKERTFGGQAWVDNIVEKDTRPTFVVTPSFFKVKPQGQQTLRIIMASDHLPKDKESVYWLNLQDIPPALKGSGIAIALRTKLKLFYRPEALLKDRKGAEEGISLQVRPDGRTMLVNTTPYT
ncbi:chaperone protein FaeE [Salmonella enterica]|uniref:Fimbria/pilus periplasmic chaperone n=1 Tax=Salmonella enterica subsp. enterica serovar Give TaxID=46626 RepID=A0A626U446_SALET|nr:chaperone protein FaeE [Salmonella enterica subsp. enterica serovar Give]EAP4121445.1 chaperone protein FaeE [Salmonella enterica subsp. enterica serovar Infantis]EAR0342472.1 chaperone protein FaeE [Salmonella enterica subsp. enterica serovar Anatum]ECC5786611.1 fimbria/pilus periplasmic chaperone [Salmonella enterica]EAA8519604.1 chaperone protein FaeE [Salmonella enterica subsp. enterica serovar Give]